MIPAILAAALLSWSPAGPQAVDPGQFVTMLESLQPELKDFRCEYEGTLRYRSKDVREKRGLGGDGLYDTFNGVFVWKAGGSTYVNALHRYEPSGEITRTTLITREEEGEGEEYTKQVDAPIGAAVIQTSTEVNSDRPGSLGAIFLIDTIRRLASMPGMEVTTHDEAIEGRPCTVLTFSLAGVGAFQRFWIDLQRGGHPIRREIYSGGKDVMAREDITLDRFTVGNATVWLPVSAVIEGHSSVKDNKPYFPKEPTSVEEIYIVVGTLEFNTNPPASTFKADYTPGTPVSDNLRRVQYEFGQQKPERRPTRAEAEAMLADQLATAEAQRSELVAGSPARRRFERSSLAVWAFGAAALITSTLVILRRR